jgi:glutamate/tyrosine decarboxylase-like PLP-dependent enzyme
MTDLDWTRDATREIGARVVEIWTEWLDKLRALPVARLWKGRDLARELDLRISAGPAPAASLLKFLRALVFDASMYPGHPRFMAYISGAGTVPGAAADLVAAFLNQNCGGYRLAPAACEIEAFTTKWFARDVFGLPDTAGGLFVSGGAMANFVALKAARDACAGYAVRKVGVRPAGEMAIYASEEAHVVIDRAADMLGLGEAQVRKIPVDASFRMDLPVLRARINADIANGVRPMCVVATAGTVATGAIDPLAKIADICETLGVWMHVDGAYGALAALSPALAPRFEGMERADSIAFDPHKWLGTPHSGGCVVVRDLQRLADSFAVHPTYVREDKDRTGHGVDPHVLGPQFSRGFQALKVYFSLLAHGRDAYARRIAHDCALAEWLGQVVDETPELERACEPGLSICCFRYVPSDATSDAHVDALNERLMAEIQADGRVYCSNAVLAGRYFLRACIVNFRTEADDVEELAKVAVELGRKLDAEMRPA